MTVPTFTLESPTCVRVNYAAPVPTTANNYTAFKLLFSSSADLQTSGDVREINLEIPNATSVKTGTVSSNKKRANQETPKKSAEIVNVKQQKQEVQPKWLRIEGLDPGKTYYFSLVCGIEGLFGKPTKAESLLVDVKPDEPGRPTASGTTNPAQVTINICPSMPNGGSPVKVYKIYGQILDSSHPERFLISEYTANDRYEFKYNQVQYAKPYRFQVSAVNVAGESEPSEWTAPISLDVVPNKPSKPTLTKLSGTSVKLHVDVVDNGSSDIAEFKVVHVKIKDAEKPTLPNQNSVQQLQPANEKKDASRRGVARKRVEPKSQSQQQQQQIQQQQQQPKENQPEKDSIVDIDGTVTIAASSTAPRRTETVISRSSAVCSVGETNPVTKKKTFGFDCNVDGLETGGTYVFNVIAINKIGESEVSEWSDEIDIDHLVPVAKAPSISILSPTTIRFTFADLNSYGVAPKITGHGIYAMKIGSQNVSSNDSTAERKNVLGAPWKLVREFVKIEENEYELQGLEFGESYLFRVALANNKECK